MTYEEKVILQKRLKRAEYVVRFQIASLHLTAAELNAQAANLSEQAAILAIAQQELWENSTED